MSSEPRRILIIEDEQAIADTLIYALRTEGFETEHRLLGRDGLAVIGGGDVDVVILDVGLPEINGFDLCRELRRSSDLPILFLTARGDEIDRIVGLELGADDYVVKPFSPREVAVRVRTILRQLGPRTGEPGIGGDGGVFSIDAALRTIRYQREPLELTRYEYDLPTTPLPRQYSRAGRTPR